MSCKQYVALRLTVAPSFFLHLQAILILWMIWNTADPQTTKRNKASSQGPTGELSSCDFDDLGTFPRNVMFFVAFSLAMRILCFGAIVKFPQWCVSRNNRAQAQRAAKAPYACPAFTNVLYSDVPRRARWRGLTREVMLRDSSTTPRATLSPR